MKAKKLWAMAMAATMVMPMAASVSAEEADLFDPANYVSEKESSEWTIAVVTKDNTVVTPKSDTILPSVTRRSLVYVA